MFMIVNHFLNQQIMEYKNQNILQNHLGIF